MDTIEVMLSFILPALIIPSLVSFFLALLNIWQGTRDYDRSKKKRNKEKRSKQRAKGKKLLLYSPIFHIPLFLSGALFLSKSDSFSSNSEYLLWGLGIISLFLHHRAYTLLPKEDETEKRDEEKKKRRQSLFATNFLFVCFILTYIVLPIISHSW